MAGTVTMAFLREGRGGREGMEGSVKWDFLPSPPPTKAIKKGHSSQRASGARQGHRKGSLKIAFLNDLAGTGGTLSITTWPHSRLLKLVGKQQVLIGLD